MFLIEHEDGKILHFLVDFEAKRTISWWSLFFVVALSRLCLYLYHFQSRIGAATESHFINN
jgi:membrane protease YdiL (CAAX protease family)